MNDIASQPVMSMYSTDPGTGLTIISPRVYRLRQLQACEGVNISELRLEQRGLAPITYMHHVSKIIEGNTESYRVRICRTCSGLPTLLELGSYTDVESALLVNDVHELMQDRTKQLHLLCVDDVKYFNSIAVRRRGSPHDLQITSVLQERLWKKSSAASATAKKLLKEAANNEVDAGLGAGLCVMKPDQLIDNLDFFDNSGIPFGLKGGHLSDVVAMNTNFYHRNDRPLVNLTAEGNHQLSEKTKPSFSAKDVRNSFQQTSFRESGKEFQEPKNVYRPPPLSAPDDSLYRNNFDIPVEAQNQGQGHPQYQGGVGRENYASQGQRQVPNLNVSQNHSDSGARNFGNGRGYVFNEGDESPSNTAPTVDPGSYVGGTSFTTETADSKQGVPATTGEQGRVGIINRPSSQALSRAGRIVDQFKANLVRYHTTFIQWNFFDSAAEIDKMFLALADFVGAELTHVISSASMRRNGSRGGGSADSAQALAVAETSLREAWKVGRAPRSSLLSTIASVFPGNSMEMQMICKRVASIIAQDTPSVSRFNDLYAQAVDEIQKIESDIRSYQFRPWSPIGATADFDHLQEAARGAGKPVSDDGDMSIGLSNSARLPPLTFCFKDCEEFVRQSYNAASYFDHSLRLCSWDGELSGVQEAEVKLHGIYAQLENRFIAITQFLLIVTSANAAAIKHAADRKIYVSSLPKGDSETTSTCEVGKEGKERDLDDEIVTADGNLIDYDSASLPDIDTGDNTLLCVSKSIGGSLGQSTGNEEDVRADSTAGSEIPHGADEFSSVESELAQLLKKTTLCVTFSILALTSAASVAWRLCGDALSAASCIRACNNFLPILVDNVSDPSILQEFIQRHLDLMTSIILYSGRSQMLGSGFGVLGPSNDGGRNFVFTRYRPSELNGTRGDEEQEEESKGQSSTSAATGQSHTELRLLAFSLGGEIVKQSRRCFASFPKQLTGPAAMVHFEAAFRAYVAIFLASLALEESDLLMKLGYTVERLLSATNDVLTSLQERITKQNCTLVSTHTLISLHGMAEACIFHSKRHVECANTVFMIVRSCRLLLWGCSPRFVLAKMLLEHIAAEEGKRLFADDKEQAAHLMTLKTAADQASSLVADVPFVAESLPYSASVSSIFSPYDQLDKYDMPHSSAPDAEDRHDLMNFEGQRIVGSSSKRYHTEGNDTGGIQLDSNTLYAPKKKKTNGVSSSSSRTPRATSEVKARPLQISSSTSSSNMYAGTSERIHNNNNNNNNINNNNNNSHTQTLNQTQHSGPQQMYHQNNLQYDTTSMRNRTDFRYDGLTESQQEPVQQSYSTHNTHNSHNTHMYQPHTSSFSFPPRSLYEKQMMTMNMGPSSGPGTSGMMPMIGNSSWTTDTSAMDIQPHYRIPTSVTKHPSFSQSGMCSNSIVTALSEALVDQSMQHADTLSCKVSAMPGDEQIGTQQQQQQQQWINQQRVMYQHQQR